MPDTNLGDALVVFGTIFGAIAFARVRAWRQDRAFRRRWGRVTHVSATGRSIER